MLKITATGNLTADPEMRVNQVTGKQYVIMRIASDRRYRDKEGRKHTDFISVKVFDALAERCLERLCKSDRIALSGDFETVTTMQDGKQNTGFLIKAHEVEFLTHRKNKDITELSINDPAELFDAAMAEIQ